MERERGSERAGGSDAGPTGSPPALRERLAGVGRPLLLDGATGTELERAGLPTGLPLWSTHALLEAPECVLQIHAAYLAAGAELVTANSFRTQRRTLARAGLGEADARLTRLAVELARHAVAAHEGHVRTPSPGGPPARAWVAGSLPPLEDCYRPDLVPDDAALAREHGRQAELLGEAGVDLILVETMNSLREARAAAAAAARTGLPFAVSFVAWAGARLLSGEDLARAARTVQALGAAVVGVNCLPPDNLEAARRALSDAATALLVSPNLGVPDPQTGFARDASQTPGDFVGPLEPWLGGSDPASPPARIVGGCCGTTPAHIAALASRLREPTTGRIPTP